MSVNFFEENCQTSNITHERFGICDDENGDVAYISNKSEQNWIATAINEENLSISFYAIDNCIEIRRQDGTMEKRCDGMLIYKDNVVFVELKNQLKDWIQEGFEQLEATIQHFMIVHDIEAIRHKRAFVANKKKKHFHVIRHEMKKRFFDTYKVRINVEGTIKIKST